MVKGSLFVAVLSSFAFGCTVGAPAGQDLFSTSSAATPAPKPTPEPDPVPCAGAAPACSSSEIAYATITECTSAGSDRCRLVSGSCGSASFYCGSGGAQCLALPTCEAGEIEVTKCGSGATCTVRTLCGTSIVCQEQVSNCEAYPSCDSGDIETKDAAECNQPNVDCYSRTTCGYTITCIDVK